MAPPQRESQEGQVSFQAAFTPLSTPLAFVGPTVACCAVGNNLCLWNVEDGSCQYVATTALSITKLAGDATNGLVAFCEGGTDPHVFVYATRPEPELLYSLSGVTELELADLAFSRCGSRLYALSRASSRRLLAFSAQQGTRLNGCELELPLRFDKVSVYPGHKDYVALVRSSGVRLVSIRKSFDTYVTRLLAAALPEQELSISAYAWSRGLRFLFATRQGALCCLDGKSGQLLSSCQLERAVTSIAVADELVVTAHIGNSLQLWRQSQAGEEETCGLALLASSDLESQQLFGQVAYLQATPDGRGAVLASAEGEVWGLALPEGLEEALRQGAQLAEALRLRFLTWFHTHPVSDLALLGGSPEICASADEGGRLRLWRLDGKKGEDKGFRMVCFTSALTSLACDEDGQLLLVGSDSGCVHVVNCVDWRRPDVLDSLRMSRAGVARLASATHEGRCMSAAALFFDNRLAFFTVLFTDPKVQMFGFVELQASLNDISFHSMDFRRESLAPARLLVVGSSDAEDAPCLWEVKAPPLDHDPTAELLPEAICPVLCSKLAGAGLGQRPTTVASVAKDAVAVGFASGGLALYSLPEHGVPGEVQAEALAQLAPHESFVSCMRAALDGTWLLSGSMDGAVRRWLPQEGTWCLEAQKALHSPYNGGVAQLCAGGELVISTGGLDGVLAWSSTAAARRRQEDIIEEEEEEPALVLEVDDKDLENFPVWRPVSSEERQAALAAEDPTLGAVAMAQRKALAAEIEGLRKKLKVLVFQNAACPELEQLERSEFCVDREECARIGEETKRRCEALRAQIGRENLVRQFLRERLVAEFWQPMETKGSQVCSLMSKLSVSNYPQRTASAEERGTLRKLRNMRRMEGMEAQLFSEQGFPESLKGDALLDTRPFTSGQESYIVNWWPQAEGARALLYQPFQLLTNARRRLQAHLLQSLAAELRADFNSLFEKCRKEKAQVMDQIQERTSRMRQILKELQLEEQVPEPALLDLEDAEKVLRVADEEISAQKWVSQEELDRRAAAKAAEEARLRSLGEGEAGVRALEEMMGGVLRTKKDLSPLEIELEREEWMAEDLAEEDMTEAQRAALKEFQEQEKALLEERERYKKQLEADLKRLRAEVQEFMQQFEASLKELSHQRFAHDTRFFCQELYCVRLQLALLQSIEDKSMLSQAQEALERAQGKVQQAEERLEAFRARVAAAKERQDERLRREKEVSSATHFRQQFAQSGLEPEAITALLQLFRRRQAPQRSVEEPQPANASADGWAREPQDPYPDLGAQPKAQEPEPALPEEELSLECPEAADEASFLRMRELRRERLLAELEVQKGQLVLQDMAGLQAHLQQERDEAKAESEQCQAELLEQQQLMERELHDVEILFQLRQGQVEVPQAAVVTDYSDAIVIDQEVVESRNRRIEDLGKDKIGTLGVIKEFRKKINVLAWEHKMIEMQTTDLEERIKDVHMLRVTKDLQSLLKGGEESRTKADTELLERKVEHLSSSTQQKEANLKKQSAMVAHSVKLRKAENAMLEKKLGELQQNVVQREHIRRLRAPQATGAGARDGGKPRIIGGGGKIEENEAAIRAAQSSFKETRARQGLMEAAKRQTEEIEGLRKELDRLRQRTFPSFVQLHEERPANPDQVY